MRCSVLLGWLFFAGCDREDDSRGSDVDPCCSIPVGDTCCPRKDDPAWYVTHDDMDCELIDFTCEKSEYPEGTYFFTMCGCGCIDQAKYGCP